MTGKAGNSWKMGQALTCGGGGGGDGGRPGLKGCGVLLYGYS